MKNRVELLDLKVKLQEEFNELISEIEIHLRSHGGEPQTTCHRCINQQTSFSQYRQLIAEAEKDTNENT